MSFFHQAILKRARRNRITHLQNPDGTISTTPEQLAETISHYFTEIFASQAPIFADDSYEEDQHQTRGDSQVRATDTCTNSIPEMQELHAIIKNMRNNAAPGQDGLNAAFYKAAWSWVSSDVHKLVFSFYQNGRLCPKINGTYIALIAKIISPVTPKNFRPISLRNVSYKIIAKSLADRIKYHLPSIIHPSQAAFVQGRHIASSIIITKEIIHSFNLKSWKQ